MLPPLITSLSQKNTRQGGYGGTAVPQKMIKKLPKKFYL